MPLRGNIVCAKCNDAMTGSRSKGNGGYYYYYHCKNGCNRRISINKAHDQLVQIFEAIIPKLGVLKLYSKIREQVFKKSSQTLRRKAGEMKKKIDQAEAALLKVDEIYVDGKIEKDSYDRLKDDKVKVLNDLRIQASVADSMGHQEVKYLKEALNFLSNLKCFWRAANVGLKDKIIGSISPQKLVFENNEV